MKNNDIKGNKNNTIKVFNFYLKRRYKYNKFKEYYKKYKIRYSLNYIVNLTKKFIKKDLKKILIWNIVYFFMEKTAFLIFKIFRNRNKKNRK